MTLSKYILTTIIAFGLTACSVEEKIESKESDEKIIIYLTGMCTDLERPSTNQEARVYDVNAYVDVYLENRRLITKTRTALLEGNYAMNPPNYELPQISLSHFNLSLLEQDKMTLASIHTYEKVSNKQVKGECKFIVCASPRCFLIDID